MQLKLQFIISALLLSCSSMAIVGPQQITDVPSSKFWDGVTRIPGTQPVSTPPNDYNTSGDISAHNVTFFSRVRISTSAASLLVSAVPWTEQGIPTTLGVWVDDVFFTTLTFSSAVGVKSTQTLALDGAAHVVDIEEQASLTNLS